MKNIKYFSISSDGKNWIESERNPNKKQVNIYDLINGKMEFKGIGQY
jgi:hypothetical protein